MSKVKLLNLNISNGEVLVNHRHVRIHHSNVVCLEVDLATKYAEIACYDYNVEEVPTIFLTAGVDALHIDPKQEGRWTGVSFKDYAGWDVFAAEVSRYTLRVTLTKSKEA